MTICHPRSRTCQPRSQQRRPESAYPPHHQHRLKLLQPLRPTTMTMVRRFDSSPERLQQRRHQLPLPIPLRPKESQESPARTMLRSSSRSPKDNRSFRKSLQRPQPLPLRLLQLKPHPPRRRALGASVASRLGSCSVEIAKRKSNLLQLLNLLQLPRLPNRGHL